MNKRLPAMIFADDFDERFRIAWRIEPGMQDPNNPLVEPRYPWEELVVCSGHGTVLKDPIDGKFKVWSPSLAADNEPFGRAWKSYFRLTYLESDDGVEWRLPLTDPLLTYAAYDPTSSAWFANLFGQLTWATAMAQATVTVPNLPALSGAEVWWHAGFVPTGTTQASGTTNLIWTRIE